MGVLACDRKGCENIMCERYSSNYGYICYDCFKELKGSSQSIKEFMMTDKRNWWRSKDRLDAIHKEFEEK